MRTAHCLDSASSIDSGTLRGWLVRPPMLYHLGWVSTSVQLRGEALQASPAVCLHGQGPGLDSIGISIARVLIYMYLLWMYLYTTICAEGRRYTHVARYISYLPHIVVTYKYIHKYIVYKYIHKYMYISLLFSYCNILIYP